MPRAAKDTRKKNVFVSFKANRSEKAFRASDGGGPSFREHRPLSNCSSISPSSGRNHLLRAQSSSSSSSLLLLLPQPNLCFLFPQKLLLLPFFSRLSGRPADCSSSVPPRNPETRWAGILEDCSFFTFFYIYLGERPEGKGKNISLKNSSLCLRILKSSVVISFVRVSLRLYTCLQLLLSCSLG
jgi:hypothetical protein